jgi:hypothetical protein
MGMPEGKGARIEKKLFCVFHLGLGAKPARPKFVFWSNTLENTMAFQGKGTLGSILLCYRETLTVKHNVISQYRYYKTETPV